MFVGDTEEKTVVPSLKNGMSSEQIYKPGLLLLYQLLRVVPLYTPVFEIRCSKDWLETLNLSFPDVQLSPPIFVIEVLTSFASLVNCLTVNCFIHSSIPPCRRDIFNLQTYQTDVRNYVLFSFTIFEESCFCQISSITFQSLLPLLKCDRRP
jgi:hypothetical protein